MSESVSWRMRAWGFVMTSLLAGCAPIAWREPAVPASTSGVAVDLLRSYLPPSADEGEAFVPAESDSLEVWAAFLTRDQGGPGNVVVVGSRSARRVELSDRIRSGLLEFVTRNPIRLPPLARWLPDSPTARDAVFALYHRADELGMSAEWKQWTHDWLMMRGYFPQDLEALARDMHFAGGFTLENEDAMDAFIRVAPWERVQPILEEIARGADRRASAAALAKLYAHGRLGGSEGDAGLRQRLQRTVEDTSAPGLARCSALEALCAGTWTGQEAWMLDRFGDASLIDVTDGNVGWSTPLVSWVVGDPKHRIPAVAGLLGRGGVWRESAGLVLVHFLQPSALLPMADCLAHPEGWPDELPSQLLRSLMAVRVPGSEPALLAFQKNARAYDRLDASLALVRQGAPGAASDVRHYLAEQAVDFGEIEKIVTVMLATEEPVDDALAAMMERSIRDGTGGLPVDLTEMLQTRDSLAQRFLWRLHEREPGDPELAGRMWNLISSWDVDAVNRETLLRFERGDLAMAPKALTHWESFRRLDPAALLTLSRRGGESAGLAAALLNDTRLLEEILRGRDGAAVQMLFACARISRTRLPLAEVSRWYDPADPLMADAAEAYLLSDERPQADAMVRAHHPGTYLVLGSGTITPDDRVQTQPGMVDRLRFEMLSRDAPDETVALLSWGGFGGDGNRVVRVRDGRAQLVYEREDNSVAAHVLSAEQWRFSRTESRGSTAAAAQ